jgi:methionine-rich copper-binding protein CopC
MKTLRTPMSRFIPAFLFVASLLLSGQAMAHAMLEKTVPTNNSTIATAPKFIDLKFGHPTILTKLKVLRGEEEIPVKFVSGTATNKNFSVPVPELKPGAYQVKWASLSGDGHAMSGSFKFTILGK